MTRKNKRKKSSASSASDSESIKQAGKVTKQEVSVLSSDKSESVSVSDVLSTANAVLFQEDPQLLVNSSSAIDPPPVFSPLPSIPIVTPESTETPTNTVTASSLQMASEVANNEFISHKLDLVLSSVAEVKESQNNLAHMFEKKLDKLRNDIMESLDSKIKALRDEMVTDLGNESKRIDEIMNTLKSVQSRLETVEQSGSNMDHGDGGVPGGGYNGTGSHDNDLTIIASGLSYTADENLYQKVDNLLLALGEDVHSQLHVSAVSRLSSRVAGRPGIVKISFQTVNEKITVLRNKMLLRDNLDYNDVYLKSSKSHAERLIELNARTILRNLPPGHSLRVDANGRIKQRVPQQHQNDDSA